MLCILKPSLNYFDAGRVIVDHIEDVDQAEQNSYQETHPTSHNRRWDDEWCPGYENEEAGGNIIHDDMFVILSTDVNIEPRQRQVTQFSVIVEEQTRQRRLQKFSQLLVVLKS